jgi:hypothetical protein
LDAPVKIDEDKLAAALAAHKATRKERPAAKERDDRLKVKVRELVEEDERRKTREEGRLTPDLDASHMTADPGESSRHLIV